MLSVTDRAKHALHEMLVAAIEEQPQLDDGAGLGFRIVPSSGQGSQLGLALDEQRPGDEVIEHAGRSVLIVDTASADLLTDLTLDVAETREGTRLALREDPATPEA